MIDYRRESAEIIANLKMSDDEIARNFPSKKPPSTRTIYNWRKKIRSPHRSQFEALKKLALMGAPEESTAPKRAPEIQSDTIEALLGKQVLALLVDMPGRHEQMTKQIDMLSKQIENLQQEPAWLIELKSKVEAIEKGGIQGMEWKDLVAGLVNRVHDLEKKVKSLEESLKKATGAQDRMTG